MAFGIGKGNAQVRRSELLNMVEEVFELGGSEGRCRPSLLLHAENRDNSGLNVFFLEIFVQVVLVIARLKG